jgi:hypothetical protein
MLFLTLNRVGLIIILLIVLMFKNCSFSTMIVGMGLLHILDVLLVF